jgi:hypothetical protein
MGGMAAQQASAINYNNVIVAELESRTDDQDRSPGNSVEQEGADAAMGTERNDTPDAAKAWLTNDDGTVVEISGQPEQGQEASGHDAAAANLQEYVDRGEGGDRQAEFKEAAHEVLDHHIQNDPPNSPAVGQNPPEPEHEI